MGIRVSYQPSAGVVGGAAATAGGEQRRRWEVEQAQRNADRLEAAARQERQVAAAAASQREGIAAQRERDAEQAARNKLEAGRRQGERQEEYNWRLDQAEADRQAREQAVINAENRKAAAETLQYTEGQKRERARLDEAEAAVMVDPAFGPPGTQTQQRDEALRAIRMKRGGLSPTRRVEEQPEFDMDAEVLRRVKTNEQGDTFILQPEGQPKIDYRPAKAPAEDHPFKPPTISEISQLYSEANAALTKIKPGPVGKEGKPGKDIEVPPTEAEVDRYVDKLLERRQRIAERFMQSKQREQRGAPASPAFNVGVDPRQMEVIPEEDGGPEAPPAPAPGQRQPPWVNLDALPSPVKSMVSMAADPQRAFGPEAEAAWKKLSPAEKKAVADALQAAGVFGR